MKYGKLLWVAVILWLALGPLISPFDGRSFTDVDITLKGAISFLNLSPSTLWAGQHQETPKAASIDAGLTPEQTYASEVLAYLLRITLGMAGDPSYRDQWRQRGLDEPLDFKNVVETMSDPQRNSLELMVMDPNILDLTTVLYHYDKGLSLYEGDYNVTSIFPASEFIGIRLLLLQKIHRREKVNLSAVVTRESLLRDLSARPVEADLQAMNLTSGELTFLREIVQSKPHLFQYLKSPFLVKALYDTGAVNLDKFVRDKISQANYRAYPCRPFQGSRRPDAIKICFVPSMTDEFVHGGPAASRLADEFQSTHFFIEMVRRLTLDIEAATTRCMEKKMIPARKRSSPTKDSWSHTIWPEIRASYLGFYLADRRPYVIYPENAAQAVQEICPQADFTVIILGRNVYKSISFDRKTDVYPAVNRIYVDITDIRHSQTAEEAQSIGCFISDRIAERLREEQVKTPMVK